MSSLLPAAAEKEKGYASVSLGALAGAGGGGRVRGLATGRLQLPPGARIGILNALKPQMTHTAVGSLRFDSFSQVYSVDWDIPNHVERLGAEAAQSALRASGLLP